MLGSSQMRYFKILNTYILVTKSISNQQSKHEHQVNEKLYKCQWILCDRVFDGLDDLLNHALEVHGFYEEDGEESDSEVSMKTIKLEDEQSIEQVNPIEAIHQDESTLEDIVEQSCATSHDHAYDHQIDHLPLNVSASLICSFAECVDLTFNHRPSLLRHTRLKHSQSLHPMHWKPFSNVRRPTQSNHVLKSASISRFKCLLCDEWFEFIQIHIIKKHVVMEVVVTGGFGECSRTLDSDREDDQQINLDQFNANPDQFDSNPTQSTSSNQTNPLLSQPVSPNLNQFCANLDQSSPSSIQPVTKSNSILEQPNLTFIPPITLPEPVTSKRTSQFKKFRTHKDIILHYSSYVSKEFKLPSDHYKMIRNRKDLLECLRTYHHINLDKPDLHESNPLPSQPVTMRLDQFNANLEQSIPSFCQFNANPKLIFKPTNLSKFLSTSSTQSNLEDMDEDDQQRVDQLNGLEKPVKRMRFEKVVDSGEVIVSYQNEMLNEKFDRDYQTRGNHSDYSVVNGHMDGDKGNYEVGEKYYADETDVDKEMDVDDKHRDDQLNEHDHRSNIEGGDEHENKLTQNLKSGQVVGSNKRPTGKHVCEHCGKTCKAASLLAIHIRKHTGEKLFACDWENCEKKFIQIYHLNQHMCTHTGEKPHKCPWKDCTEVFTYNRKVRQHFMVHVDKTPFKCPWEDCHKEFTRIRDFRVHAKYHTETIALPEKSPTGDYICKHCDRGFKRRFDLKQHIRTHTGERPYKCSFDGCNMRFALIKTMRTHYLIHTGMRPHVCNHCRRAFKTSGNLTRHIRIHTGERPFECPNCRKTFIQKNVLKRHIFIHTGERPHVCEQCNKAFKTKDYLKKHSNVHRRKTVEVNDVSQ